MNTGKCLTAKKDRHFKPADTASSGESVLDEYTMRDAFQKFWSKKIGSGGETEKVEAIEINDLELELSSSNKSGKVGANKAQSRQNRRKKVSAELALDNKRTTDDTSDKRSSISKALKIPVLERPLPSRSVPGPVVHFGFD